MLSTFGSFAASIGTTLPRLSQHQGSCNTGFMLRNGWHTVLAAALLTATAVHMVLLIIFIAAAVAAS